MIGALLQERKALEKVAGVTTFEKTSTVQSNPLVSTGAGPNISVTSNRKKYEGLAKRILNYMGSGCNEKETAEALGCDVSYISQLYKEKDFFDQVQELRNKDVEQGIKIDTNYNEMEMLASDMLVKKIPLITDSDKLLRVLKFANEAKRKVAPSTKGGDDAIATVVLTIPMIAREEFVVNQNNEIVQSGSKEFVTIANSKLEELMIERNKKINAQKATQEVIHPVRGSESEQSYHDIQDDEF